MARHSATVRVTHWITTLAFLGLLVSGIAILLAHPRLYWGETGGVGGPALIDLPLPFVLAGQTGWGRSLHILSAWVCVATGVLYTCTGLLTGHFRKEEEFLSYNVLQRIAYILVVFVLFPLMIWTGFAMSPAITSVLPALVEAFGGQQSARTIHFFVTVSLVLFLAIHVTMVCRAGFRVHVAAMFTGHVAPKKDTA